VLSLTDNGRGSGPQAHAARLGQSLARAVVRAQGGTLSIHEGADEIAVRIWLPATRR
jgi:signal transduction histidine kinase